jgi:hypothetical protein
MKQLTIIFSLCCVSLWAQQPKDLPKELSEQKVQITKLQTQLKVQENTLYLQKQALQKLQTGKDSLAKQLQTQEKALQNLQTELSGKIEHNQQQAEKGFTALHQNLSKRTLYWGLGALLLLLLGGGVYYWLSKRIRNNQTDIEAQLHKTKLSLEEETVKLDNKLVELLESQLKVREATPVVATENAVATDHSLALKVADEIVRMQKNIAKMSDDVKGLKPLLKGIERIQNNFLANGYEMINLLNKDYDERMNIDVINFITDKNLPEGRKVISAVIKPQVNYNGVLIQRAQVDVSQN